MKSNFDDSSSVNSQMDDIRAQLVKFRFFDTFVQNKKTIQNLLNIYILRFGQVALYIFTVMLAILMIYSSFNKFLENIEKLRLTATITAPMANQINMLLLAKDLAEMGDPALVGDFDTARNIAQ